MKKILILASILGATGVVLGAFGAHALKAILVFAIRLDKVKKLNTLLKLFS